MEEKNIISREELEDLKREIEGIKSTIEILQDKDMMEEIAESERLERKGVRTKKIL